MSNADETKKGRMPDIAKAVSDRVKEGVSAGVDSVTSMAREVPHIVGDVAKTVGDAVPKISQEQMMDVLDSCYQASLNGLPGGKTCEQLAQEYLSKHDDPRHAADEFVAYQIAKCSASGFITGFGGVLTLPVSVPANVASVIYVQMRMIATLAVMAGYDVHDDRVQTLVYLCLVGTSVSDVVKSTGVKVANKVTMQMLKKVPGTVLTKINQKVGFRLVTKFGEKGAINLVKVVPVAGALVGAGVDFAGTIAIANQARSLFFEDAPAIG